MLRFTRLALAAALTLAVPAAVGVTLVCGERAAFADEERSDIAVGTELEATSDVTLHQAEIAKGSKVSVTKVLGKSGQIDGLSVALADGHVVKVTMTQVHSYFRVIRD
jgi:hypothetical protein